MQLHFELWKNPSPTAKNLVLLHGMGGTGALWRPIAASLESNFNLLAFDQRGHGKSIRKDEKKYDPASYAQDVVDSLRGNFFYPAYFIGHSMGVRTAVVAATLAPKICQGLILVDLNLSGIAGGGLGETLLEFLKKIPDRFPSRAEAKEFLFVNAPDPSLAQYLLAVSQSEKNLTGKLGEKNTAGVYFPFDRAALIETINQARGYDTRGKIIELAEMGKPILMLRGGESKVWSREEYLKEKTTFVKYPNVELREVAGTGHGLPFDKRIEFCEIVREWTAK